MYPRGGTPKRNTKFYQSTNGGQSFTQVTLTPAPTNNLKGVHLDEDGYGYVVGEQGQAYKITPAATQGTYTITKIATDSDTKKEKGTGIPTGYNLESVQFSDRLTGYITGKDAQGQGMVLKTVDGGLHWTTKESGTGTTIPQLALSGDAQQGTLITSTGTVNALNDQSEQISSRFWYDELGRLILSQNARQFICTDCPTLQQQQGAKAYSYTLYDEIGRIKEVGELLSTVEPTIYKNRSQIKYSDHTTYVTSTTSYRHQVTTTKYDRTDRGYTGFTATYLRNRVAYTTYQQTPTSQIQESHYSYDVHGNVKSMLQVIRGDGEELTKRIDYEYDLVSGKVNKVTYQKDNSDQFIHQYTYDGDNRIIQVATSTDDIIYTKEATYQYYAHGPLARINYGELHVETQDFAYTIQGWIKQVQGQVFAYALGYNNTDYSPIGEANQLATPIATNKGLYNGNIATMSSKTQVIDNNNPWVQQYTYDQLNRIKTSTTQGSNHYATSYSYDANGNIVNLTRKNNAGGDIDNLTYNYENKSSGYQRNTNRLRSVDDAVATTGQTDDIEDQQEDNYAYDATGNLIYDRSEEIESIQWTVSGKVLKVIRTTNSTKPNLEFTYDASGNRIAKKVIQPNGDYKTTFYVRDASGNVMAVYKTSGTTNLTLEEQHIYGSSRLGIFKKDKTRKATTRALGERRYELTDHLGNVRVVLSDYKKAESIVISATDYYPFGMVARTYTSPEEYRYGFNGKEKEKDIAEGAYAFEYRIHDPRLGRFLSVDPWCYKYSYQSPYVFAHNTPVSLIDYLGLGDPPSIKEVKKMTTRKDVVKFKHKDYTMYFFKEDPTKLVISNGKEFHLMDFQSAKMLMPNSSSQIATEEETQQLYPDDQAGNYNRKGSDVWKQDFKATFEMLNFKFKNGDVAKDVLKEFLNTTKGQGINVTVIGNYGSNVNNNNIYKSRTPDVKFEGTLEEFAKERAEFVKTYLFGDNKYAEVYSRHELPGPNVMKKYGDIFLKPVGADPNGITIIFTFPTPKFK